MLVAAILLNGCSRESSIRENVTLRNNHSVVFASTHPFEKPEAFADSVTNLSNPDSVIVPDTLTVTINDTIYMMGFLKHNADKIGRYYWILDSLAKDSSGKFSKKQAIRISNNATPITWVYPDTGLYSPLFVAIDGNNATDTAGADQFIRVINTPPTLAVPKDTLWTKHKIPITFPIFAKDSFGTIASVKVDLDAGKKKSSPKQWDFKTKENNDSLFITIPLDTSYVDSIGNQTIYVIVTDDDGNEAIDSVYIHFNQLPKLELQYPEDKMRVNKNARFAFYYQAKDVDNPGALRYFIRAAKTRDNGNDAPVLNDGDLIAKNLQDKSFEAVTPDGTNLIGLEGRIYWDVWVTDGYDTVYADKITDNGVTRPRSFFLGNPDATTGRFIGFANLQGMSANSHTGIRIVFQDTEGNRYYGHDMKDNGYFYVDVPEGVYEMIAMDTLGRGFSTYQEQDLFIEVDDTRDLGKIILKDTIKPVIRFVDDLDTLTGRSVIFAGKFTDKGSQVKSASAWFDGTAQEFSNFTISSWSVDLNDMLDGEHLFKLVAQDSAGNVSDTLKVKFYVAATNIKLTVDGQSSSMTNDKLEFKVSVAGANPPIDSIEWKPNVKNAKKVKSKISAETATLTLTEAAFNSTFGVELKKDTIYEMYVISSQGTPSNKVRFGYFDDNPVVYFEKPSNDTTITINDVIEVSVRAIGNNEDKTSDYELLQWNCGANATRCPSDKETAGNASWSKTGNYTLTATITNNDGKIASDVLNVHVISDPPTIRITTDEDTIRAKINSSFEIPITAKDKFGIIKDIKATCGSNSFTATFAEAKEVTTTIPVTLPNTENRNYKCVVQATDDDGEIAKDTLTFQVLSGKPTVSLNIKSQTLTILDRVPMNFFAEDSIGEIVMYEYGCSSNKKSITLKQFDGSTPTLTMPNTAGAYYCAILVTDDDNNTAGDTATYNVLLDPPTVRTQGPYSVTIKDELNLDAIANDQYGRIVKYEWGCGPKSAGSIGFTYTSTSSPQYTATMPSIAQNDYRCVIRVTDDDGNAASDTVSINVLLAPPTVVVANESAIIRQGYNIVLNADAHDYPNYPGEIVKREWSCGATSNLIEANWKTVSSYDTVWKAPAAVAKLYCVARATDDDGNIAMDTMTCSYSTDVPVITVKTDSIYAVPGDVIVLGADTNSVWQGINWYNWQCFDKATKKALDAFKKLDYKNNYTQVTNYNKTHTDKLPYFYEIRDLSDDATSMYCVVQAEESSTKVTFSDTTFINVLGQAQKPVGVISVADTIYPRSGNIAQTGEALYFYTNDWGGYNSVNGAIGNNNARDFWWHFGTLGSDYYQGLASGKLDTNIAQFNTAFIRPTEETQFNVCLDFRDSTKEGATQAFLSRHQADEVCKTIYVRKAWRNLASTSDTVLEYNNKTAIPPAIATVGTKVVSVYATGNSVLHSKSYDGSKWTNLTVPTITGTIKEIKAVSNGSVAYLAVLTAENNLTIYQSNGGTSAWATYGSTITNVTAMDIACKSSGKPIITYINNNKPKFSYLNESNAWASPIEISATASQEVKAVLVGNYIVFIYVKNNFDYTAYYAIYSSTYAKKATDKNIGNNIKGISLAANGSTLYMAYLNQDVENMKTGPYMRKGTVSETSISWTDGPGFNVNIIPGTLSYNIHVATNNGKVLVAFDDQWYMYAQSHVYYHDGTGWSPYGETDLPYFYSQFINTHGYYLRGYDPTLSISSDGKVYLSMLAWENAGGSGKNYGPIVMKYVADNWTVKDFRN
ncbi:MAG: hypothetical protein MJY47_00725 [Fibrobacter sp.]|nr:hypothetical protein [Fibrobacter sp.]